VEHASPQAVAALLKHGKDALLSEWEAQARTLPEARHLSAPALRDHLPGLVDELARELEQPQRSQQLMHAFFAHQEQRVELSVTIAQVIEEYRLLRTCIANLTERAGLHLAGETHQFVDAAIDEGIKTAVQGYIDRCNKEERRRREEYLTFVVHDLRSPLAAIYNAIVLLERQLGNMILGDLVQSILAATKRNIERMQALIIKLLHEEQNVRMDLNVLVERQPVELHKIVDGAIRMLAPLAASCETQIINQVPPNLTAFADPELMERVFRNLISNSIEFTHRGTVYVGAVDIVDGGFESWISDNGQGIPEELKPRVFERFHTDRKRKGGIGLGLAVVKRIVEAHGGRISLESESGRGTTVRFTVLGMERLC
jgi:two-component system, OmpR family, phosphate regulon sensor histidine kinase PhoR